MSKNRERDLEQMEYSIKEKINNLKNADINASKAEFYEDALDRADKRARDARNTTYAVGGIAILSNIGWWIKTKLMFRDYQDKLDRYEEAIDELMEERED